MGLLLTQKNDALQAIMEAGFDPSEFQWQGESRLVHKPSGFYFSFDYVDFLASWSVTYAPGRQRPTVQEAGISWQEALSHVPGWLFNASREIAAPDLWAQLEQAQAVIAAAPSASGIENTPFTADEQREIASLLNELKQYAQQTLGLEEAAQRALEERLDYLEDAARRGLGRVDWWNLVLGAMISQLLAAVLPAPAVRELLTMIGHGLGHLFGAGVPELPAG